MSSVLYGLSFVLFTGFIVYIGIEYIFRKWKCTSGKCEKVFGGDFTSNKECKEKCVVTPPPQAVQNTTKVEAPVNNENVVTYPNYDYGYGYGYYPYNYYPYYPTSLLYNNYPYRYWGGIHGGGGIHIGGHVGGGHVGCGHVGCGGGHGGGGGIHIGGGGGGGGKGDRGDGGGGRGH